MVLNTSATTYIFFIIGFFMVDIFCDQSRKSQSPWQANNNNGVKSQILQTNTTTPWPDLNQRRNLSPTRGNFQHQPMWVQNGSNWVRNSLLPTQSSFLPNANSNTVNSRFPWQNNQNNINSMGQNIPGVTPRSQTPFQNQNSKTQNTVINFDSSRKASINNNRNTNVQFINNERTNIPNSNKVVANHNNNLDNTNGNRGAFSSGPFGRNQENSTYNSQSPTEQVTGEVDDNELREFSETLLSKDTNNAAKYVTANFQKMTSSRSKTDEAPLPLLTVNQAAFSIPSISKLLQVYNNYILETNQNEVYTAQEKIEESDLLDTILSTSVMQFTRNFLIQKGNIGKDPKEFKDLLRSIWFNMYSRGGGRIGSSGFEHVFLAELKNSQVSGLHNWVYFHEEEKKNTANYLGYMKKLDLGDKGSILKYHFVFHDKDKPVGGMFIGTSPEFEMALYTTCFVLRADKICPLKLNGNRFIIRTYTFRYRGKNMIGSAFPEI